MPTATPIRALIALALAAAAAGCAPVATYPPIEGAIELSHPSFAPIPGLMVAAIEYAHARHGGERDFAVNLPEGTPARVYDRVIKGLGEGKPMTSPDEWAYHVTQVRSRGMSAEVDLIYPRERGPHEFVTIHFQRELTYWRVRSTRLWRYAVDVPAPHYVPAEGAPAEEAHADATGSDGKTDD